MIDPKICPFCKKQNGCQAHIPNNNCWCNEIKVPSELIELSPKEFYHKACICKECILLFKEDKDFFISKYVKNS